MYFDMLFKLGMQLLIPVILYYHCIFLPSRFQRIEGEEILETLQNLKISLVFLSGFFAIEIVANLDWSNRFFQFEVHKNFL